MVHVSETKTNALARLQVPHHQSQHSTRNIGEIRRYARLDSNHSHTRREFHVIRERYM
jgi:hypothetical protein